MSIRRRAGLVFTLLCLFQCLACHAQVNGSSSDPAAVTSTTVALPSRPPESRPNVLSFDFLKILFAQPIFYHRAIADNLVVGGTIYYPIIFGPKKGYGIQPEIRYALSDDDFSGLSIGATGWFDHIEYSLENGVPIRESASSVAPTISYIWEAPSKGAYQQITLGAEYIIEPTTQEYAASMTSHETGFVFYMCFRLGVRW